jgi:predicted dinucleotide-binding enzyme
MKIAILGTGMVGNAIATKLVQLGHQIMMGSRTANSDAGQEWLRSVGGKAQIGTFSDVAAFGEIVFDCTNGANSLAALRQAGAANLSGKILIQVGNPLDTSKGMPPTFNRLQHRLARRTGATGVSRRARGEGAQHGELRHYGRAVACAR